MSVEEKFIAINRATKQYYDMLLEMYREISEMHVKFELNVKLADILQSLVMISAV